MTNPIAGVPFSCRIAATDPLPVWHTHPSIAYRYVVTVANAPPGSTLDVTRTYIGERGEDQQIVLTGTMVGTIPTAGTYTIRTQTVRYEANDGGFLFFIDYNTARVLNNFTFTLTVDENPNPPPTRDAAPVLSGISGDGFTDLTWTNSSVLDVVMRDGVTLDYGDQVGRFRDNSVVNGTTYSYVVEGTGGTSNTVSLTPTGRAAPPPPSTELTTPTTSVLTAISGENMRVRLEWTHSDYRNRSLQYKVQRASRDRNDWADIATLSSTVSMWTDRDVTNGTVYYYRVRAEPLDGGTIGAWSNERPGVPRYSNTSPSWPTIPSEVFTEGVPGNVLLPDTLDGDPPITVTFRTPLAIAGLGLSLENSADGWLLKYDGRQVGESNKDRELIVDLTATDIGDRNGQGVPDTGHGRLVVIFQNPQPEAPVLPALVDIQAHAGVSGAQVLPAARAGRPDPVYDIPHALPPSFQYNPTNRALEWTEQVAESDSFSTTFRATNSEGSSESDLQVTVFDVSANDGAGSERVFRTFATETAANADAGPSNDRVYDAPDDAYSDGLGELTGTNRWYNIWERLVPGIPAQGESPLNDDSTRKAGWGNWTKLATINGWAEPGVGEERVFRTFANQAAANADTGPSNNRVYDPSNPTDDYTDGLTLSDAEPWYNIWERKVPGLPAINTPPFNPDNTRKAGWGNWRLVGTIYGWGEDGEDGERGSDGTTKERVYRVHATSTIPTAPERARRYDVSGGGFTDGLTGLSSNNPWYTYWERDVPGSAQQNDSPISGGQLKDGWSDWTRLGTIYGWGRDGSDGDAGTGLSIDIEFQDQEAEVDRFYSRKLPEPTDPDARRPFVWQVSPDLPGAIQLFPGLSVLTGTSAEPYEQTEHTLSFSDARGARGAATFNFAVVPSTAVPAHTDLNPTFNTEAGAIDGVDERMRIGDTPVSLRLELGEVGSEILKAAYRPADGVAGTLDEVSMPIDLFSPGADQLHQGSPTGSFRLDNRYGHHDDLIDSTDDISDTPLRLYANDMLLLTGRLVGEPQTDFNTVLLSATLAPTDEPFPVNIYRGVRCLVENGTSQVPIIGGMAEYTVAMLFRARNNASTLNDLFSVLPAWTIPAAVSRNEVHRLVFARTPTSNYVMIDGEVLGENVSGDQDFPNSTSVLGSSRSDLAVFSRFVDRNEAETLLQNRISEFLPGLVALWRMDEYEGDISKDVTENHADIDHANDHRWVASGQGDPSLASVPMPLNLYGRQQATDLADYLHSTYRYSDDLGNPTADRADSGPLIRTRGADASDPRATGTGSGLVTNVSDDDEATNLTEPVTCHEYDGGARLADILQLIGQRAENLNFAESWLRLMRNQAPCFAGTSRHQSIPHTNELLAELIGPCGWNWHYTYDGLIKPEPLIPPVGSSSTRTLETAGNPVGVMYTDSSRSVSFEVMIHAMPSGGPPFVRRVINVGNSIVTWNSATGVLSGGGITPVTARMGEWNTITMTAPVDSSFVGLGNIFGAYRNVMVGSTNILDNMDIQAVAGLNQMRFAPALTLDLSTAPGHSEVRHLRRIRKRDLNFRYALNRSPMDVRDVATGLSAGRRNDMITPYREIRSKNQGLDSSPIEVNSPIARDRDATSVTDLINWRSGVTRWAATVVTGSRAIGLRAGDEVMFTPHSDRLQTHWPRAMRVLGVKIVELAAHRGPRIELSLWG